jgi:hypothetical protein
LESANLHGGLSEKNVSDYIIFPAGFTDQGVLNKDPTVWLEGARPHLQLCKTKIAESYIKDTKFSTKTNQRWKLPNNFEWGIMLP